jgi:hypothetical protein
MNSSPRRRMFAGLRAAVCFACTFAFAFACALACAPSRAFAAPVFEMTDGHGNVIDGTQVSIDALSSGLIISMTYDTAEGNAIWRGYPTLVDAETGLAVSTEMVSDLGKTQVGSEVNELGFPRFYKWSVLYRVSGLIPGHSYQMTMESSQGQNQPDCYYTYSETFSTAGSTDDGGSGDQGGSGTGESTDPEPDASPDDSGQGGGQDDGTGDDAGQGTSGTDQNGKENPDGAGDGQNGDGQAGGKSSGGSGDGQTGSDDATGTPAESAAGSSGQGVAAQGGSGPAGASLSAVAASPSESAVNAGDGAASSSAIDANDAAASSADEPSRSSALNASSLMSMGQLYKVAGGASGDAGGGDGDVDSSSTTADVTGVAWLWLALWLCVILAGPAGIAARAVRLHRGLAASSRLRVG